LLQSPTAGGKTRKVWIQARVRNTGKLHLEQVEGPRGARKGNQHETGQTLIGIFKEGGFKYLMSGVNIEVVCFFFYLTVLNRVYCMSLDHRCLFLYDIQDYVTIF